MIPGKRWAALGSVLAASSLLAAAAFVAAEHEPGHRYFFVGIVTNDRGEPLCEVTVRAADLSVPDAPDTNRSDSTDLQGRYTIQLHLHDSSVSLPSNEGDTVRVSVDGTAVFRDVIASPNTRNPDGWGEQEVDLVVPGRAGCGSLGIATGFGAPLWVAPLTAGVLAAALVVAILALSDRRRSSRADSQGPPPGPRGS